MQSWLHCKRRLKELRPKFVDLYITSHDIIIIICANLVAKVDAVCEDNVKCIVPGSTCMGTPKMCKCAAGFTMNGDKTKCLQGF